MLDLEWFFCAGTKVAINGWYCFRDYGDYGRNSFVLAVVSQQQCLGFSG